MCASAGAPTWTHTHTHAHAHTHRGTHRHTHRERETDRQTDTHAHNHTITLIQVRQFGRFVPEVEVGALLDIMHDRLDAKHSVHRRKMQRKRYKAVRVRARVCMDIVLCD